MLERNSRELPFGVKCDCFQGMGVLFEFYKGTYSTKHVPQNILWGKIGCKTVQNSCLGVFFSKGQISFRVCFENVWSFMCTTLVFECPRPPPPIQINMAFQNLGCVYSARRWSRVAFVLHVVFVNKTLTHCGFYQVWHCKCALPRLFLFSNDFGSPHGSVVLCREPNYGQQVQYNLWCTQ